jgi:hypothetical protein
MIIDIHDVWHAASVKHEQYVRAKMEAAWKKLYRVGPPTPILAQVYAFVRKHETEIVCASTRSYIASVRDYDSQFPPGSVERTMAEPILNKVFEYDTFRDASTGWRAYELCASSPYRVCPYCHLVPTDTKKKDADNKGYRPQLDHFITKADYPFLALSLGNLVPSCGDCNGPAMKHDVRVLANPHLFPLADTAVLTFKLRPRDGQPWSPLLKALRLPLDEYEILIDTPSGNVAAQNSLQTFQLTERYQNYLHEAYRIAKMNKNPAWLRTIAATLGFHLSLEDQLGFPIEDRGTRFKNIPQGKMRLDVYVDSRKW